MEAEISINEAHTQALEKINQLGLSGSQRWVAETNVNAFYAAQRCEASNSSVDQAFASVWKAVANGMGVFGMGGLHGTNGSMDLGYYPSEVDIYIAASHGRTIEPTPPRIYVAKTV